METFLSRNNGQQILILVLTTSLYQGEIIITIVFSPKTLITIINLAKID
jgi:hypothetical protein